VAPFEAEKVAPEELALLALQRAVAAPKSGGGFQGAHGQRRFSLDLGHPQSLATLVRVVTSGTTGSWPLVHALQLLEHASAQSPTAQRLVSTEPLVDALVALVATAGASSSSSSSSWRPPPSELLGAALRVLVNVTHHNPPAVALGLRLGLLPPLLGCLRSHCDDHSGDADDADWLLEEEDGAAEGKEASPSFDLSLLAMNALTNCVEISADARALLTASTVSGDETALPFLASLVVRRAAAFREELAKPLEADAGAGAHPAEGEGAWPVEDLVVCGYASLLLGCLLRDRPDNLAALQVPHAPEDSSHMSADALFLHA
jgi:hypothetical protein